MGEGEDFGRMIFFMVMMLIGFIQWAAKRLKMRREARRWQEEVGREQERERRTPTVPPKQERRPQPQRAPAPVPASEPVPSPATATATAPPETIDDLRELFKRRETALATPPPTPEKRPALPVQRAASKPPKLPKVRRVEPSAAAVVSHPVGGHRRSKGVDRHALDKLLKSPDSAKLAIVLGEVLGEPVGIRGERQR